MGSDLRAVIYVENDVRELVYLQPELTAETLPEVTLYCDGLSVHQSARGCSPSAELDRVDMTVQRFEDELTVTVSLGVDAGMIFVFAPTESTDWPMLVAHYLAVLSSLIGE